MNESAQKIVRMFPGSSQMASFASELLQWIAADLRGDETEIVDFTESRARALLRSTDLLDDPSRHSLEQLLQSEQGKKLLMYDLLSESSLDESESVRALAAVTSQSENLQNGTQGVPWLALVIAAFAWKSDYPLYQFDPASPPANYSTAGQVIRRSAHLIRLQIQRSATDRDRMEKHLQYMPGGVPDSALPLDSLPEAPETAPLPPHYRPPVPVSYPEYSSDTVEIESNDLNGLPTVTRGDRITITYEDLEPEAPVAQRQPSITIDSQQVAEDQAPRAPVTMPPATVSHGSNFAQDVRRKYSRSREPMKVTKLMVEVQDYPDGPGLYGVQVQVSSKGIKSYVAGTTDRDGKFKCELPVRESSGLTYDVSVTWPRDLGGDVESKSITLNADRTIFTLPFYRHSREQ